MRYIFVQDEAKNHSIELLCKVMEVSRSGYYAFNTKSVSTREKTNNRLMPMISEIFYANRNAYGYRRMSDALKEQGENCGKHKISSLMRQLNLKPTVKRRFKLTTDSNHGHPIFTNVLNRKFKPSKINQAWTSDITYIDTHQGWLYLVAGAKWFTYQAAFKHRINCLLLKPKIAAYPEDSIVLSYFIRLLPNCPPCLA